MWENLCKVTISIAFVWLYRYLVVHLQDSLTMKRMTSFLLLYPQNQGIFWKGDRNMGSNWFSFNWIKRIKICLRYSCQNARAIFEEKTTNWWIVFNSFKNHPNPKYSRAPNFTPEIFQSTWASVSYLPKHSHCSIQPFMNQMLIFIITCQVLHYALKM